MKAYISINGMSKLLEFMRQMKVTDKDQEFVVDTLKKGLDAQQPGLIAVTTPCGKIFFVNMEDTCYDTAAPVIMKPDVSLIRGLVGN
ncbi:MAG: hypothetical protein V4563_17200 [Pseudomonadota bacterium]